MDKSQRIVPLDILRGVAVVIMIMGHSIDAVFDAEARASELFRLYDAFRGFTAPLFLFVAGWAFTVATVKRWETYIVPGRPLLRRLRRIGLLLAVGYILHFPFFSFAKLIFNTADPGYAQLYQVDVLQCVAISLLILQVMVLVSRTPQVFALNAAVAAAGFALLSPVVWSVDFRPLLSDVVAPYLNQQQLSPFPLFPYAAYMFAGSAVGYGFLAQRAAGRERRFSLVLAVTGLGAVLLGIVADLFPLALYPVHDFWRCSPEIVLIRTGAVALLSAGFFTIRVMPKSARATLVPLGQASFLVYGAHLVIVYGSSFNAGLAQAVGQVLPVHLAVGAGLAVLASMILLVHGWGLLRTRHLAPVRYVQAGAAVMLLYMFLTSPY